LTFVYRNGVLIGVSSCSTGKAGKRTPTGVFTILQKRKEHYSSIYNNAPMPYMQRLTWRGIALHAGDLPGYPASAGCVRLPLKFARNLFNVTHMGTPVILADARKAPTEVVSPGLILPPQVAEHTAAAREAGQAPPSKSAKGWQAKVEPVIRSIVVSKADRRAVVMLNGKVEREGEVRFRDPDRPVGTRAFALLGPSTNGGLLRWMSYGLGGEEADGDAVDRFSSDVLGRIEMLDPKAARAVALTYRPGTTLVVTDLSAGPQSRSAPNFVIADGQPYRMPRSSSTTE